MVEIDYLIMNIVVCTIYISLYGFIRALISIKLGDRGADAIKRHSLSPKLHIDSIGFLFMFFYNLGFIKPMRNQTIDFKNKKGSIILIAVLPMLLLFILSSIIMWLFIYFCDINSFDKIYIVSYNGVVLPAIFAQAVMKIVKLSTGVLVYNLLPIYPLEAERIFNYHVSINFRLKWGGYTNVLQMLLIFLTVIGVLPFIVNEISNYYIGIFV